MDRKTPRIVVLAAMLWLASMAVSAQDPTTGRSKLGDELNRVLNDPAEMAKAERERSRPPIEIFKSYVMPNDVLPFVKANHWSTMAVELRSNAIAYAGSLETGPIQLENMPQSVVFRREATLVKGQKSRLLIQFFASPTVSREIKLSLLRPESLRDDETYTAAIRLLEPHQMLIPVLTKGPNDAYGRWNQLRTVYPLSGLKNDAQVYDRQKYYRMVLPAEVTRPELPSHPLTWTTISHVIWDGMPPETLSISQQEAMLDWLHWGGQIIIVGGAGPAFAPLRESFLGPYLPAEPSGQGAQLTSADLEAFVKAYPPYANSVDPDEPIEGTQTYSSAFEEVGKRYKPPAPIFIPRDKPIYVTALTPKAGARVIGFEKPGLPPLAVEWRVGRGRITMLSVALTDPQLIAWPGYETLVRRVVLRRPEENLGEPLRYNGNGLGGYLPPRYDALSGPDLTWLRLFGRDLGAPTRRVRIDDEDGTQPTSTQVGAVAIPTTTKAAPSVTPASLAAVNTPYQVPVAEWLDSAALPTMSRQRLEHASGIEIPGQRFVLMVILAYMALLVPVNWLVCRFAFGRKELAWLVVPVLAMGFAFVVERAAAYDVGYDSACNEIDLIETFGDYPRGHLSRFASLYTTGRVKYAIAYPGDPTALALPLNTGRSIRGEDVQQSTFQATPTPSLTGFQVQPRSLAMFRAEQLTSLPGTVTLTEEGGVRKIVNGTGVELKDAIVVEIAAGVSQTTTLGTIDAKATVELKGEPGKTDDYKLPEILNLKKNQVDPRDFLTLIVNSSIAARSEDIGEIRLIAWMPSPRGGQTIEPAVDVHQGFTLVVAHLKVGPTPDPSSPRYNLLARGPETPSTLMLNTPPPAPIYNNPVLMRPNRGQMPKAPPRIMPIPPAAIPTMPKPKPVDPNDVDADGNPKVIDPETDKP